MKLKLCSVYDSKTMVFNTPFFQLTTPAALRSFGDLANDPQSTVFRHPGDYVLYELGEFDDATGEVSMYAQHKHLGIGSQFLTAPATSPAEGGNDVSR